MNEALALLKLIKDTEEQSLNVLGQLPKDRLVDKKKKKKKKKKSGGGQYS